MHIKKFSPLLFLTVLILVVSLACNFMSSTPTDAPDDPVATEEVVETEDAEDAEDAEKTVSEESAKSKESEKSEE